MLQCRPRVVRSLVSIAFALCLAACGPPLISPGQPQNGELRPGETAKYRFELQAGELFFLTVDQIELDAVINLYGPDGKLIGDEVDTFFDGVSEDLYYLVEKTGTYTAEIGRFSTQNGTPHGLKFSLAIEKSAPTERDARQAEAFWKFTVGVNRAHNSGDCQGALTDLEEASRLWRDLEEPKFFATSMIELARCQRNLGSLQKSSETLNTALNMPFVGKSPSHQASLLQILGETEGRQGLFKEAATHEMEALSLFQLTGNRRNQGSIQMSLCTLKYSMGLNEEAADHCKAAAEIGASRADTALESRATSGLAAALRALGRSEDAIVHSRRALALTPEGSRQRALALTFLASCLADLGDHDRALELFKQAESIYSKSDNVLSAVRAKISIAQTLLALELPGQAFSVIEDAFSLCANLDWQLTIAQVLETRARILAVQGDLSTARQNVEEAFSLIESVRPNAPDPRSRALLLAAKRHIYELRVELAMGAGGNKKHRDIEAGLRAAEQASARTLIDVLNKASEDGSNSKSEFALSAYQIQNSAISPETALLRFFLGTKSSFSWLVTTHGIEARELPSREVIDEKSFELAMLLREPEQSIPTGNRDYSVVAAELSELLQLRQTLSSFQGQSLVIVPDGNLHLLPFTMLPVSNDSMELLIDRFVTTYSLSATALVAQRAVRRRQNSNGKLAVLADPVFREDDERLSDTPSALCNAPTNLPRLPQTAEEATAIASLGTPAADVFQGFDANKSVLLAGNLSDYQYLHFATHGVVNPREPDQAALILSCFSKKGDSVDSRVTLDDLESLRLNAELVVLSACRTAQGEHIFGEGLMGLTRGFMNAGVPRVIASLWTVQDSVTRELMQDFYTRLLDRDMTPAVALHEAQLELRKYRPAPYHWAAFILQGEWQ